MVAMAATITKRFRAINLAIKRLRRNTATASFARQDGCDRTLVSRALLDLAAAPMSVDRLDLARLLASIKIGLRAVALATVRCVATIAPTSEFGLRVAALVVRVRLLVAALAADGGKQKAVHSG